MSSTSTSTTSIGWTILFAIVSFVLGLLTPPIQNEIFIQVQAARIHAVPKQYVDFRKLSTYTCSDDELANFLSDIPIPGYHIICMIKDNDDDANKTTLNFYSNGQRPSSSSSSAEKDSSQTINSLTYINYKPSWEELHFSLQKALRLQSNNNDTQPWAIFTPEGQYIINANGETYLSTSSSTSSSLSDGEIKKINTANADRVVRRLMRIGMFLIYQGGQFIWPGIRIGYERTVSLYSIMPKHSRIHFPERIQNVTLVTLSLRPLVLSVQGFLSDYECDYIQQLAIPNMDNSDVSLMDNDIGRPASDFRTSSTAFLDSTLDTKLWEIDYRTASLVRIPREHQEPVQVLRYNKLEKYSSHHDYFDKQLYTNDKSTLELIQYGRRNRMVTVFWYLTNVSRGGETVFPRMDGRIEHHPDDCSGGLLVTPQRGKVIIFYSLTPNGQVDSDSLHGACPVQDGVKWAANKWIWNEPMTFVDP